VPLRKWLASALTTVVVLFTAFVSVGLTAPADGPFSIVITPVFVRLDRSAIEQSRARVLGFDVDVKIGSMRIHLGWSAVPISSLTTKTEAGLL
jgi:hypothetical protein